MNRFCNLLKDKSPFQFIFLVVFVSQIISFFLAEIAYLVAGNRQVFDIYEDSDSFFIMFSESVIVAPVLETLFMFLTIEMWWNLLTRFKYRYVLTVFLAGGMFGALHIYNIYYIFISSIVGVWYVVSYLFLKKNFNLKWAFWGLVLIHALDNLITIGILFSYVV